MPIRVLVVDDSAFMRRIISEAITAEPDMEVAGQAINGLDALIKYEPGGRQVLRWQEVAADREKPPMAFQERGVYLITGGLGGLGVLFAQEILEQTREARVVLTGRSALSAEKQATSRRRRCLNGESKRWTPPGAWSQVF